MYARFVTTRKLATYFRPPPDRPNSGANIILKSRRKKDLPVKRPSELESASLDAWDNAVQIIRRHSQNSNSGLTPTLGLRIALLIDAESTYRLFICVPLFVTNIFLDIAYKNIDGIMNEVEKLGIVQTRRIYADWTSEIMRGWRQTVLTNALTPVHQFQSSIGKGNSDSMMIIDAMDILYRHREIEAFCIVSSDADFTRLATKIREEGKLVLGIGSNLTPAPFVVACNRFVYLHNLMKETSQPTGSMPQQISTTSSAQQQLSRPNVPVTTNLSSSSSIPSTSLVASKISQPQKVTPSATVQISQKQKVTTPSSAISSQVQAPGVTSHPQSTSSIITKLDLTKPMKSEKSQLTHILPVLTRAWAAYRNDNGWAPLEGVTSELQRIQPDFSSSTFGNYFKLEDLLEATELFEVRRRTEKDSFLLVRRVVSKPAESTLSSSI